MRLRRLLILGAFLGSFGAAFAQDVNVLNGAAPYWVLRGQGVPATIDFDFAGGRYYQAGLPSGSAVGSLTTTSRASTKYCSYLSGLYISVASNVLCVTDQGALIEEARTNSIRNNSMQGAVAGSPGTQPTNWVYTSSFGGLTGQIVGTGTESGIDFIDVRYSGTSSGTLSGVTYLLAESNTNIAATYGQTWTASQFAYVVAGSLSNVTLLYGVAENNAGGTALASGSTTVSVGSAPLGNNRLSVSRTFTNTATAFANLRTISMTAASGAAIDFTLRIGWPQLENNNINSSVASATVNNGGSLYVGTNGTMTWSGAGCTTNPVLNVTDTAGIITAVNSVATAGSCTTFPSSSATTWTAGGGLSTGSGASFNLTPTNNATAGFATSPIRTTNAAVARAADVVTVTKVPVFGSAFTLYAEANPESPTANSNQQAFLDVDDGTSNNRADIRRANSTGVMLSQIVVGGVTQTAPNTIGVIAQGSIGKAALRVANSSYAEAFTGGNFGTASGTVPTGISVIQIGGRQSGSLAANAYIRRVVLWPQTGLSNATLQGVAP